MLRLLFAIKSIADDPYEKALEVIDIADKNSDHKINKQEFIAACTTNEWLRNLFNF